MRPVVGASSEPASARKASVSGETSAAGLGISNSGPTSFMLASQTDLDRRECEVGPIDDSTYGVCSIDDDTGPSLLDGQEPGVSEILKLKRRTLVVQALDTKGPDDNSGTSRGRDTASNIPPDTISQPLTPVSFASHAFGSSVPSSPKSLSMRSFHQSDEDVDGGGSHAIISSEDEGGLAPPVPISDAPPQQLIMPSLIMPSRRPFTERGRSLGRLNMMVAGSSRVGKTSLIKSIIQSCEDIVHVDSASLQSLQTQIRARAQGAPVAKRTDSVTEIHASTKAHPQWWTEMDGSDLLQRRRSIDENVLARNLCLIDTPGFDRGTSILEGMEPALKYLESQIRKSISPEEQTVSQLLGMLSGQGGTQVDVVLYLLDHDLKPADVEYIRQLNRLSNVIPLLAKADSLDVASIADLKCAAAATLSSSSISVISPPFIHSESPMPPFTVCSSPSIDLDTMDASVLMQSECIQPFRQSELPQLIDILFEPMNVSYFKHSAASKALAHRSSQRSLHLASPTASLSHPSMAQASVNSSLVTTRPPVPNFPQPSGHDHHTTDSRVAQLRLAAWASSLQRSLAHERRRYERLAQGERLTWLRAQLDAYNDAEISESVAAAARSENGALLPLKREFPFRKSRTGSRDLVDPLGIVRFRARARHATLLVLKVAGGCGIIGAAVVWALHRCGTVNGESFRLLGGYEDVKSWIWSWWPDNEGVPGSLWA